MTEGHVAPHYKLRCGTTTPVSAACLSLLDYDAIQTRLAVPPPRPMMIAKVTPIINTMTLI
ncbi:hypothetical protein PRIPAC_87455 [Pristionchus pacificus]|uniref:Uncharacterized protein n=1 Tax=Pristionchus pacificus TaxID=54126 RepID=A0A2A6B9Q3_PRIPA|nr:hypothetical protein PRIPAC_87455 [Pristionchus pacificus]|eukprot:PDM62606.1 hypothetical protein PRIPAC_52048 [Pristionchus pacificus]